MQLINKPSVVFRYIPTKKLHNIISDMYIHFIRFGEHYLDLEIAGFPKFQKSKTIIPNVQMATVLE